MSIGVFCCCRREEAVGGEEVEEAYAMKARSSGYVDRFLGLRSGKIEPSPIRVRSRLLIGQTLFADKYIELKELQTHAYDIETLE